MANFVLHLRLDEFIEHTWAGLEKGLLDIPVGIAKEQWSVFLTFSQIPSWILPSANMI